jgi:hypothetical protein
MKAIYGQDVAPGFADWYLGRTGYDSQQTSQPVDPNRPDNLFAPVEADYAAHGIFTDRAQPYSTQSWVNLHRLPISLIAAGIAGAAALAWGARK